MKAGDVIEWVGGVNQRIQRGTVTVSKDGEYYILLDSGHSFALADIRFSKSAKLIEA